jgi:hypothetical protein
MATWLATVLFHAHLPPALIDFSPYWRPPGFASVVVIADALVWESADSRIHSAACRATRSVVSP